MEVKPDKRDIKTKINICKEPFLPKQKQDINMNKLYKGDTPVQYWTEACISRALDSTVLSDRDVSLCQRKEQRNEGMK